MTYWNLKRVSAGLLAAVGIAFGVTACTGASSANVTNTPYIIVVTATGVGNAPPPPGSTPTPLPDAPQAAESPANLPADNVLVNPGFEGESRAVIADNIQVMSGWEPFFCGPPFDGGCRASRAGGDHGNPAGLKMGQPYYSPVSDPDRVFSGATAQSWSCPFITCRAGVYQRFETTPGHVCEVGVMVRSWSTNLDPLAQATPAVLPASQLDTPNDRENVTWYIRIDPRGGTDAWAGSVRVSSPIGYSAGIYDQFTRISQTFIAERGHATVFFENVRLWPLAHNDSFIDDAYATCAPPTAEATEEPNVLAHLEVGPWTIQTRHERWPGKELGDFLWVGDELWAYYTEDRNEQSVLRRAISKDGLNWKFDERDLLTTGEPGSWDAGMFAQPTVVRDPSGGFHLWYMGRPIDGDFYSRGVGYATSPDGINWTKASSEPVLTSGAPGAWNEERIDSPDVLLVDGTYILYHNGSQLQPTLLRQIGCFLGTDGLTWAPCPFNPVFAPRPNLAPFEGLETEQPSLIIYNGIYLMAYTGYLGNLGPRWQMGIAASPDGTHWSRLTTDPIIPLGADANATTDPVLVLSPDGGTLYLYYTESGDGGEYSLVTAPITYIP